MVSTTSSMGVLPLMRWLAIMICQSPAMLQKFWVALGVTPDASAGSYCLPVQQINIVRLQPPQGLLDGTADELGIISELTAAVRPDIVAELGG